MPLLPVSQLEQLFPAFRGKAGNAVASFLRKYLSVSKLSDYYDEVSHLKGADFTDAMLDKLGIDFKVAYPERLQCLPQGPFITVSNHPYGGMDGVVLLSLIGSLRPGFKVMVNEFLALIEPLRDSWIVVNPKNDSGTGVTGKNIQGVKEVLTTLGNGEPVGFFPSGAISDFKWKGFKIRDREWQEPVLRLIQKARVPIIPVRFFDRNSAFFYFLGLIDWKLRSLRLPREIVNKKDTRIRVGIGQILSVEEQLSHPEIGDFSRWLRESVYGMPLPQGLESYSGSVQKSRK